MRAIMKNVMGVLVVRAFFAAFLTYCVWVGWLLIGSPTTTPETERGSGMRVELSSL